jgi:2',3'-cyclic-nucleotide 2'-phosphodiesterase/3'-nucleotidase/5'-nucleotidase
MFYRRRRFRYDHTFFLFSFLLLSACKEPVKVSFLLTNDIHGHLEGETMKDGVQIGGMSVLGSIVDEIKNHEEYQKNKAALFVLDSGDQFQGTLMSNFNEGQTVIEAMNEVGYDAAVPGNHDYDFGPLGWLYDKVTPGKTSENPREVIENLSQVANFPLLSANTYLKNSVHFAGSKTILDLDSQCKLKSASTAEKLDFDQADHPSFLKPYAIFKKAGVRVALIGLDHHSTASTTTVENVADLCFRDEVETYLEIRKSLEGKADVFVLMIHNGNSDRNSEASDIVKQINEQYPDAVHLAAAGHTHFIHNAEVNGVRVIQNGANNQHFGRVDLIYDPNTKKVFPNVTKSKAGIPISATTCEEENNPFCDELQLPLEPKIDIELLIQDAKKWVEPIATRILGEASEKIYRSRTDESPMSNALTDALREAGQTQIALMNTGGIRADLDPGTITYEKIFEVIPFSNMAVVMNSLEWRTLKKVLAKSITTCGRFGALMQSGLRIQFSRNCSKDSDLDPSAKLIRVETKDGKIIYDQNTGFEIAETETFSVTTLDFLASGGSGFNDLSEAKVSSVLGIARELIADTMEKTKPRLTKRIDGRFVNIAKKP